MSTPAAPPLAELENPDEFTARHIGIGPQDEAHMLRVVGAASRRALIDSIVPPSIARHTPMAIPPAITEAAALAELRAIASKNQVLRSFIGQGYYGCHTPGVIQRNILENPAWYTAYTPYQAEISQGRLEALINFQTMVCDLTAMPIANASMLDEATAAAEAMTLARRSVKSRSNVFVVAGDCHPQTIEVIQTRAAPLGLTVRLANSAREWDEALAGDCFAVLASYPSTNGRIDDLRADVERAHARQAAFIVAADLLALTVLTPPGEWGADIVIGTTQRFGMPLCNGGPHAAYLACRDEFKRSMPGRLAGVSVDVHGHPAYRLALQTREQHIRREKATSNICTAQVLPAVIASMYAIYHGPAGLQRIALRVATLTAILAQGLQQLGYTAREEHLFDTLSLKTDGATDALAARAVEFGVNLRVYWRDYLCISLDETTTRQDLVLLWRIFAAPGQAIPDVDALAASTPARLPPGLRRSSRFLSHPVFNSHHSETGDAALHPQPQRQGPGAGPQHDPAGQLHDEAQCDQRDDPDHLAGVRAHPPVRTGRAAPGLCLLDQQLRDWLCARPPGMPASACSPMPAARENTPACWRSGPTMPPTARPSAMICLIPASAHGTNPASAQMAGLTVVVTACDAQWQRRHGRPAGQCERHSDRAGRGDDHLPQHARRVRDPGQGTLRAGAPPRRPRLCGWRQHECAGRRGCAGRVRRRRQPPEPAQDLLHPARRRRPGRRPGLCRRRPGALPAGPCHRGPAGARCGRGQRRAAGQCGGAADQLDVLPHDGAHRACAAPPKWRS
jgi:glycine dehydrogenase